MTEETQATETTSEQTTTNGTPSPETEAATAEVEAKTNGATEPVLSEDGAAEERPVDWRNAVPEEYRKQADRFASLGDVFKSMRETRKAIDNSVQLPTEKSTEEEVAKFRKKAGIPEKVEDYNIEQPEWASEENFVDFMGKAHALHLTPGQVQAVIEWEGERQAKEDEAYTAEINRVREAGTAALKKEWGADYDANLQIAHRAAMHFMGEKDAEELLTTELKGGGVLGDHPAFLKAWVPVGRAISESVGFHVRVGDREDLEAEKTEIEKLILEESQALVKDSAKQAKISAYFKKAYPSTAPADGRAG